MKPTDVARGGETVRSKVVWSIAALALVAAVSPIASAGLTHTESTPGGGSAGTIRATGTMRSITRVGGTTIEDVDHRFLAIARDGGRQGKDRFEVHFRARFWHTGNPICTASPLVEGGSLRGRAAHRRGRRREGGGVARRGRGDLHDRSVGPASVELHHQPPDGELWRGDHRRGRALRTFCHAHVRDQGGDVRGGPRHGSGLSGLFGAEPTSGITPANAVSDVNARREPAVARDTLRRREASSSKGRPDRSGCREPTDAAESEPTPARMVRIQCYKGPPSALTPAR